MKVYNTQKVFDCITEIYNLSQSPSAFSISNVCRKHNLGSTIGKIMVSKGIVKVVKKGRPKTYIWQSHAPHVRMANSIILASYEYGKSYRFDKFKKSFKLNVNDTQTSLNDELNNTKSCVICEKPFVAKLKKHKFCSDRCRHSYHNNLAREKKAQMENQYVEIKDPFISDEEPEMSKYRIISPFEWQQEFESNVQDKISMQQTIDDLSKLVQQKEEEIQGLKDLKSEILEELNSKEKLFKERTEIYDELVEKLEEKIEILEERTKGKKYNPFTDSWGDEVKEKNPSQEYNFFWGMVKIKK
jgi:endogenous inhibitor of DNA gyrase (YacG/DUF329 family)